MREAHLLHVLGQLEGQLPVAERAVALIGHAHPGAEVDLVHGPGGLRAVEEAALAHPLLVAPLVFEVPEHGSRPGRYFGRDREGVRLVDRVTAEPGADVELVGLAFAHAVDAALPDARPRPW